MNLITSKNLLNDNSIRVKLDEYPLLDLAEGLEQLCLQVWRDVRGEVGHAHRQKYDSVLGALHEL